MRGLVDVAFALSRSVTVCLGSFVVVLFVFSFPGILSLFGVFVVVVLVLPSTMYVGVTVFSVGLSFFPLEITASGSVIDTMNRKRPL